MYGSFSQLPVSYFTPQQLVTMGQAMQVNANANAMAQTQAQPQLHARAIFPAQGQTGGQSAVMAHAQRKTNAMLTGKARKKATKFHTLMAKTKKNGAQAKNAMQLKKATRPLNSYIAFRSFYSKIFKGYQQKNISGLLSMLWKADPFQAKWAILAKGFSEIRDVKGKTDAALPEFLDINASLIGIIEIEQYLTKLGWKLTIDAEANPVLLREADFQKASLGNNLLTTNVSVADVVENSYKHGYIAREGFADNSHANGQAMIMASSAQPAAPMAVNGDPASSNKNHEDNLSLEQQMDDGSDEHTNTADLTDRDFGVANQDEENSTQIVHDVSIAYGSSESQPASDAVNSPGIASAGEAVEYLAASSNAALVDVDFNMIDTHVGSYPHNLAFDPEPAGHVPVFDPFKGDAFDPFDISDMNNFSMSDWFVDPNESSDQFGDDLFEF